MLSAIYEWLYKVIRVFRVPIHWVFGTHPELRQLVESGQIPPGRAIDLGCGTGREAIYLATRGFEVTGVDISPTAIRMARKSAARAGAHVEFIVDDLTNLRHVDGQFDLLLDYGALNDLNRRQRDAYMEKILPLCAVNSLFVLMGFDNKLPESEIDQRFGATHDIRPLGSKRETAGRRTLSFYLMRKMEDRT